MRSEKKTYNIQLLIDSQLEHVRLLGGAVRGIGNELDLSADQVGQLELVMVEAVNNVIEHAYKFKAGNGVQVCVECEPNDSIKMIITDNGHAIPPEQISAQQSGEAGFPDPENLPEGGWGLGLINMLADSFHYECDDNGNHLHVCKQLA